MKYARKINFPIKSVLSKEPGDHVVTIVSMFHMYETLDLDEVTKLLPEELKQSDFGVYMVQVDFKQESELIVHYHFKEKCVLNIYLETNGEKTSFYEGPRKKMALAPGESRMYRQLEKQPMNEAESFVAQPGECWLIKTRQPHGVTSVETQGLRKMIQVYFADMDYDTVLTIMEKSYGSY